MTRTDTTLKVGEKIFEIASLTGLTGETMENFAFGALWEYAQGRWTYDEETKRFKVTKLTDRRELAAFDGLYSYFTAVLESDKNGVFEEVEQLVSFANDKPKEFEGLCQAIFKVNPTLDPNGKKEAEKSPNA